MKLLESVGAREAPFIPYLNTANITDVMTGVFIPGTAGNAIMNGGLAYTNAVVGREQRFKSTTAMSLAMAAMAIYPRTECLIYDTEDSLKRDRVIGFGHNVLLPERNDIADRLTICSRTDYLAEAFFHLITDICKEKESHKKDYMVESPFVDPRSGKPLLVWIPTLIGYDSWSKMASEAVQKMYEKADVGSSEVNTTAMKEGLIKSRIMSQIPSLAAKYGLYFIMTAHIGDKIEMNPYAASPKDLPNMKGGDKIKHVGADFTFLASNLLETREAKPLQDSDKECMYPDKYSTPIELNKVTCVINRCKNNVSGASIDEVVSQSLGIQSPLTNYQYLKDADYYGLIGSKQDHSPCLLPDIKLDRKTVRGKLEDYKTARAVELIAQLHYIQNNWILRGMPVDFTITIKKFAEILLSNQSYAINDILESRGYWTYDKENPRSYLSIMDSLMIIENRYRPKWIGLRSQKNEKIGT